MLFEKSVRLCFSFIYMHLFPPPFGGIGRYTWKLLRQALIANVPRDEPLYPREVGLRARSVWIGNCGIKPIEPYAVGNDRKSTIGDDGTEVESMTRGQARAMILSLLVIAERFPSLSEFLAFRRQVRS